ncbi:MAG: dTDP-4-dehydrorhamnose reductase [Sedimentisphaerales bacterium]|nr:dTDP-4-dehydrorhamnose reductase [Sedimentisphaerales bacterium]
MIGRAGMGKETVAILGGRGMLGRDLAAACTDCGFEARVYDLPEFDLLNSQQVREVVNGADAVINCAAYTNVGGAESQKELAHRVNGEAVGQLGRLAADRGRWLLHFSTDFVFDGALERPYRETDAPNPINEYGRSKLAGERLLEQSGCAHCIVRLEWTYGAHGNNFVTKIVERARATGQLTVVNDQIGAPTATMEVSQVACRLLARRVEGLFHFANCGYASRFDVARFIVEQLALSVQVSPCGSADYPSPARRPLNSRFDCSKIQALLGEPIHPWQEPLTRFLRTL